MNEDADRTHSVWPPDAAGPLDALTMRADSASLPAPDQAEACARLAAMITAAVVLALLALQPNVASERQDTYLQRPPATGVDGVEVKTLPQAFLLPFAGWWRMLQANEAAAAAGEQETQSVPQPTETRGE